MSAAAPTRLGTYVTRTVTGDAYRCHVPAGLPPEPPLDLARLYRPLDGAMRALGGIDALSKLLPDVSLFLYMYIRKEALVSSQIEGTQSSFSDLLLFENEERPGTPVDDVEEVSNYVAALNHGLARLRGGFPLSTRLIREMHGILLRGGRGAGKAPGEFRRSQNWIGGTRPADARHVPPPPEMVGQLMGDLERFAQDDERRLPALIKAALVHVQFETIHPFLDGNGRLGRLLITLLLCSDGVLTQPILYLSLHFKRHRALYYDLLQDVRLTGDWERWCEFFLEGVTATATQAADDARKILDQLEHDRARIARIGRAAPSALKVHAYLFAKPYLSIPKAATELGISVPAATTAVRKLVDLDVLRPTTAQARNRIFAYEAYLAILAAGTEPLR